MDLPFGYMARWGRFTEIRGTLGPEDHEAFVSALLEGNQEIRDEQEARRARLHEILKEVDSVDLLARASLTYAQIDPDTFKEWESDQSPAHTEYLALQALGLGLPCGETVDPMRSSELTMEAIDLVREMFRAASMLIVMDAIADRRNDLDDPVAEYALKTRLESLAVRGTGYVEHLVRVLHGCLDPFDDDCRRLLGFTASDALAVVEALQKLVSDRLEPGWIEAAAAREDMLTQLKRARRRRGRNDAHFPDWLLDLPPREAKAHVSTMVAMWLFADARSLAEFTPEELSDAGGPDAAVCRAVLDAFECAPNEFIEDYHAYPYGGHPLATRPVLRTEAGYFVPTPSAMLDAIRPRIEDLLAPTNLWERYADARGRWAEEEATRILASALPGSESWVGIPWASPNDSSDLDGLVATDDVTIRLQCKAGRLTAAARRGAPGRMKRDIGDLIESAAEQHRTLAAAISTDGPKSIGFSDRQARALNAPLQFEAIVCLDDVTVWATEAHELRRLGVIPEDRDVPWVLSLTDLMAVVDLLDGAQLVHYLVRRQRIERDGRVEAHDELDWVGHYIAEGLYFDDYFDNDDPPHTFRLLSYTEPIDSWYFARAGARTVDTPKPAQQVPPNLASLIRRLESGRPSHWTLATTALLDGDDDSRQLWDQAIEHARRRVAEVGWSNASQVFKDRIGVTVYVDLRTPWPAIRTQVESYCQHKAEEEDMPNWLAVGEGEGGGLFVTIINRDPSRPFTEAFLAPPSGPPRRRSDGPQTDLAGR